MCILERTKLDFTSREQTFDPRPKWALVPVFFTPGTRDTFSPGWWIQPGLKVPAQRLLRQTEVVGTFTPGWWLQPGLKVPTTSVWCSSRWAGTSSLGRKKFRD